MTRSEFSSWDTFVRSQVASVQPGSVATISNFLEARGERDIVAVRKLFIRFNVFQIRFLCKWTDSFFLRVYEENSYSLIQCAARSAPSLFPRGLPTFRIFDTLMRPLFCFWVVKNWGWSIFFERKFVCKSCICWSIFISLDPIFFKQWCFNRIWIFLQWYFYWILILIY